MQSFPDGQTEICVFLDGAAFGVKSISVHVTSIEGLKRFVLQPPEGLDKNPALKRWQRATRTMGVSPRGQKRCNP